MILRFKNNLCFCKIKFYYQPIMNEFINSKTKNKRFFSLLLCPVKLKIFQH